MNNIIKPDYYASLYGINTALGRTKQTGTVGTSFFDMASLTSQSRYALASAVASAGSAGNIAGIFSAAGSAGNTDGIGSAAGSADSIAGIFSAAFAAGNANGSSGVGSVLSSLAANGPSAGSSVQASGEIKIEATEKNAAPTLESMLKAKYPGLAYHVFDASTSYWKTRNDYPHYMLYDQDCDVSVLENWKPTGTNPFYGSIDGKFIAPKEIHALGNVPPGSKAVVIHPDVQKRMEEDPDYAYEIMATIDNWFAYDVARNEAIMPGHTIGMSQAVAIGKDGTIVNAAASKAGGTITRSSDEMVQAYYRRLEKREEFMRWLEKEHMKNQLLYSF